MTRISASVLFTPYSKLYILTELSANDVKFISSDRQKLDLSKCIYLKYRKFYICSDTARFYEQKNDPRTLSIFVLQHVLHYPTVPLKVKYHWGGKLRVPIHPLS